MIKDQKPKFQYELALSQLDTTLIRGLTQPKLFDADLCPAQTVVLGFGQKGTHYHRHMIQRIDEAELGVVRIVIDKHNIETLATLIEASIEQVFHRAQVPHVLVLENFEHVVFTSMQYKETADYCGDLAALQTKLAHPQHDIVHGILCLSNVPPVGAASPVTAKLWDQFDARIGYGTLTREQQKLLFEWYFAAFMEHCNHVSLLRKRVRLQLSTDDLDFLLMCSVQATEGHIKQFCQSLFRGVVYEANKANVCIDREFIENGGPEHGFLHRIGTQNGLDDEDEDLDDQASTSWCIVPKDLVGIQDGYEIAAHRGPYMGAQPIVTMGQEKKEARIKKELEEEDKRKEAEERKRKRIEEEYKKLMKDEDEDEMKTPFKGKKIAAFGSVFKKPRLKTTVEKE